MQYLALLKLSRTSNTKSQCSLLFYIDSKNIVANNMYLNRYEIDVNLPDIDLISIAVDNTHLEEEYGYKNLPKFIHLLNTCTQ